MTRRQAQWIGTGGAMAGIIGGFVADALFDSELAPLLTIGGLIAVVLFVAARRLGPYKPTPEEAAEAAAERPFAIAALPLYGLGFVMLFLDVLVAAVVLFVMAVLIFEVGPRIAKRRTPI